MKPKDKPDYTKCRKIFEAYLKIEGITRSSKLDFSPAKKTKKIVKNGSLDIDTEESDGEDKPVRKRKNGVVSKAKSGKKPRVVESSSEIENCENEEPEEKSVKDSKPARMDKRKSLEPSVVIKVKKAKMAPKATPPAKKNHANIATQTSADKRRRSPRQVTFDSPICEIIEENKPKVSKDNLSVNSSGDIFDDSFVIEEKKVKPKRKLLSDERVTVKRVVKKKVTTVKPKARSWKDSPTVVNGRSPPK